MSHDKLFGKERANEGIKTNSAREGAVTEEPAGSDTGMK